ncbi:hypothetical protein [Aliikangiella maris]|uniref:Acyl carrier protein n=2 Tax=Aliikangiella maris TaxID=3162458 RepID=A0ABV3MU53_9GAMM
MAFDKLKRYENLRMRLALYILIMDILYIILAFVFVGVMVSIIDKKRMTKIALERGEPNICEYARSFDYRKVDTKIMREVWNEVQECLGKYNDKYFPVKADDVFEDVYKIDTEELDYIYWAVADRLGIDTEEPESNPYFNKVTTVKNLVLFLHHQSRSKNV